MRSRLALTALALAGTIAVTGCSSGSETGKSGPRASNGPTVPAACKTFQTQVKNVSAKKRVVVTLARTKHYRGKKTVTAKKPVRLQRLTHVAASISATPDATIAPDALLTMVVKQWEKTTAAPIYRATPGTAEESMTIPATGDGKYTVVGPDKLLWFRGWDYVAGHFQWSSCRADGATLWHEGVFHTFGRPIEGALSCDPLMSLGNLPLRHKRINALCRI